MVRDEGLDDGTGIWEIPGYQNIEPLVKQLVREAIENQNYVSPERVTYECTYIVGSYGSGMGVKRKSDLDIMVLVMFDGDLRSYEFSKVLEDIAGHLNYNKKSIIGEFSEIADFEAYVYPLLESEKELHKLAQESEVTHYYDLTEDEKKPYYENPY